MEMKEWFASKEIIRTAANSGDRGFRACTGLAVLCEGDPAHENAREQFFCFTSATAWLSLVDIPGGSSWWPDHPYTVWLAALRSVVFVSGRPALHGKPTFQFDFANPDMLRRGVLSMAEKLSGISEHRLYRALLACSTAMTTDALAHRSSWKANIARRAGAYSLLGIKEDHILLGETVYSSVQAKDPNRRPTLLANYRDHGLIARAAEHICFRQSVSAMHARNIFLSDCVEGLPVVSPCVGEFVGLVVLQSGAYLRIAMNDKEKSFVDVPVTRYVNIAVHPRSKVSAGQAIGHDGPPSWIINRRRRAWDEVVRVLGASLPRVISAWVSRQTHSVCGGNYIPYMLVADDDICNIDHARSMVLFTDIGLWDLGSDSFLVPPLINPRHDEFHGCWRGTVYDFSPHNGDMLLQLSNAVEEDGVVDPTRIASTDDTDRRSVFLASEAIKRNMESFYARRARKAGAVLLPAHVPDSELDAMINGNRG